MLMRVFVAGGTGVVGRRLVPQLVARGRQVTATATNCTRCFRTHEASRGYTFRANLGRRSLSCAPGHLAGL